MSTSEAWTDATPATGRPAALKVVHDRTSLVRDLRELGVRAGDALLVRVDFGQIGRIAKPGDRTLVESLLEAVGSNGTLVALTHSPVQWLFQRDDAYVYHPATAPCITGRFATTVLQWPGAERSRHPTCSMTAVGASRHEMLAAHDRRATCFQPIKRLMDAGGKLLLIGCTQTSPGFSTVHYAYEELGLATRSLLSGWLGCYFEHKGKVHWFRQLDVPGCSRGFHKFYPLYQQRSALRVGRIGNAESFLISAATAFEIEVSAIAANPRISLCDDPRCFSCRTTKLFNWKDMPSFWWSRASGKLKSLLGRRAA